MKTFMASPATIDRKWYVVDAEGKTLGRLASEVAKVLSMVYTPDKGIIPITEEKQKYGAMINPLNEEYRAHILNVLKEVVTKYPDLDGLMLDRVRYDGITADFSPLSREKFEAYIGKKVGSPIGWTRYRSSLRSTGKSGRPRLDNRDWKKKRPQNGRTRSRGCLLYTSRCV